jgi:hypothetical protein
MSVCHVNLQMSSIFQVINLDSTHVAGRYIYHVIIAIIFHYKRKYIIMENNGNNYIMQPPATWNISFEMSSWYFVIKENSTEMMKDSVMI